MELRGDKVVLRQSSAQDAAELVRIRDTPEVLEQWGPTNFAEDLADTDVEWWTVRFGERIVGAVQWYEHDDPDFHHAGMDIFLDPAVHGQGLGTDTVRTMARHLVTTLGFHRLVIDPAAANAAAIACYTKAGFKPVGVMREYWRDPQGVWQDGLLMDLLAAELR
ncbi:GNAT family protein [Hamadaea sp. NPDC050747]|uniref:GNAT family N-acetyltransferase n=1 Tax=Hamadaea sp. NPDC050747 TaxID=3155789 RepID=UPI0033D1F169